MLARRIEWRFPVTKLSILPFALTFILMLPALSDAQRITYNVTFTAHTIQVFSGPNPPPVDPVLGSFQVTLDPNVAVVDNTADISLTSLNISLGSTLCFSYSPVMDGGFPPGTLRVGGLFAGSDVIQFRPSTNDFWLYITDFPASPEYFSLGYTQTSVSNDNLFGTIAGNPTGSVTVSSGPVPVPVDSFLVVRGLLNSGGVAELEFSDNADLSVRRSPTGIQSVVELELKGVSPTETPTMLELTVEASVFARSTVNQSIWLFDYAVGDFEQLDLRAASRLTDLVTIVVPLGDLSRFVEPGTRCMKAKVLFESLNPRQQFTANIDQILWQVE